MEGLKITLEVRASFDPEAAKSKAEDFVDVRVVEELKKLSLSINTTADIKELCL